jgi:hypothetical protein
LYLGQVAAHDVLDDVRLVKLTEEERTEEEKRRDDELARREAGMHACDAAQLVLGGG